MRIHNAQTFYNKKLSQETKKNCSKFVQKCFLINYFQSHSSEWRLRSICVIDQLLPFLHGTALRTPSCRSSREHDQQIFRRNYTQSYNFIPLLLKSFFTVSWSGNGILQASLRNGLGGTPPETRTVVQYSFLCNRKLEHR